MRVRAKRDITFETSRGPITIRKGETFRPADPQKLIREGLAEPIPLDSSGKPQALKIWSEVVQDEIWLLLDPAGVSYIPEGAIFYTRTEIENLRDADPQEVKAVHTAKKFTGGRLIQVLDRKDGKA